MPAYAAPIEVVQAALHRIGEEGITDMSEDSSAARIATSNYEGIVRGYFARHAWTFAKQTLDLTHSATVELGTWTDAYTWPGTVLNIRAVMRDDGYRLRAGEYAIESGRVLTLDDEDLQILATVRAPEADWPGDFSEAVVTRMQALFLESLCDKYQDARLAKRDAEALIVSAIVRDKRQEPGVDAEFAPLAEARMGRRPRRGALYG